MKRIGGFRRKTRRKFKKNIRAKGKISIKRYLQEFKAGDKIALSAESSLHKGMYFPRFHGKIGVILEKRGNCYEIMIKDHNKEKKVIVHPIHLVRL